MSLRRLVQMLRLPASNPPELEPIIAPPSTRRRHELSPEILESANARLLFRKGTVRPGVDRLIQWEPNHFGELGELDREWLTRSHAGESGAFVEVPESTCSGVEIEGCDAETSGLSESKDLVEQPATDAAPPDGIVDGDLMNDHQARRDNLRNVETPGLDPLRHALELDRSERSRDELVAVANRKNQARETENCLLASRRDLQARSGPDRPVHEGPDLIPGVVAVDCACFPPHGPTISGGWAASGDGGRFEGQRT